MFRLMKQLDFHHGRHHYKNSQEAFSSHAFSCSIHNPDGNIMVLGIYAFGQTTDEFSGCPWCLVRVLSFASGRSDGSGWFGNDGISTLAWVYIVLFFVSIFLIMLNVLLRL